MGMTLDNQDRWFCIATIEIDAEPDASFSALTALVPTSMKLRDCAQSPSGFRWVDLLIDRTNDTETLPVASRTILTSLSTAAEGGLLPGFRIVHGAQWANPVP